MDYHELKVAIRAMGFEIKKPEALELMSRYDTEETGHIGFEAFEEIMAQRLKRSGGVSKISGSVLQLCLIEGQLRWPSLK